MRNAKVIESEIEFLQKQISNKQKELDEIKMYSEMADKIMPIILKWKEKENIPLNKVVSQLKTTLGLNAKKDVPAEKNISSSQKKSADKSVDGSDIPEIQDKSIRIKVPDSVKDKLLSLKKNIPVKDIKGIAEAIEKATSEMDVDVYLRVAIGPDKAKKYMEIVKNNFAELKALL